MTDAVRVGGVPEHFNLPWIEALEAGAFDHLDRDVEWIDHPEGTGSLIEALESGEIDMATPLTEGIVTSIANGARCRILGGWVSSPLLWGVHVAAASAASSIADVIGARFAISRYGSGSELMARVLAAQHGWSLTDDSFVVVGGLAGALEALPSGRAETFLWSRSMTQPHVDDGTFRRIADVVTPWPSLVTAVGGQMLSDAPALAVAIADVASAHAREIAADPDTPRRVAERYGLDLEGATRWFEHVRWADRSIDAAVIDEISSTMLELGRIDHQPRAEDVLA